MRMIGRGAWLFLLALLLSRAGTAWAGARSIKATVNGNQMIIEPRLPVVNVFTGDSLLIEIAPEDPAWRASVSGSPETERYPLEGSRIVVNFEDSEDLSVRRTGSSSVSVHGPRGSIAISIWKPCSEQGCTPARHTIPIELVRKPWLLEWSAGFAGFYDVGFTEYALRSADGQTTVSRGRDCAWPSRCNLSYKVAAFAHYVPDAFDWIAVSMGLGTEVPIERLTAMLGVSLRFRTFEVLNDGYLTVGYAFTPVQRLSGRFDEGTVVADPVTAGSLYDTPYGFVPFVSLTFGFFGGEGKFKGVVSSANGK